MRNCSLQVKKEGGSQNKWELVEKSTDFPFHYYMPCYVLCSLIVIYEFL